MTVSISAAEPQIKDNLNKHFTPDDILDGRVAARHDWRDRLLGPVTTIHALLLQILHAAAMTGVSRLVGVAFSPSAYCQALQRLPVEVMRRLLRSTAERQRDATEQKSGFGFPVAHLPAMFDAYTGMLVDVLTSSWRIHDMKRVGELHSRLRPGDLLVGDRGFCSFAHLALLGQQGIHTVMRMHQRRRVSFKTRQHCWAGVERPVRLGRDDQLTLWRKTGAPLGLAFHNRRAFRGFRCASPPAINPCPCGAERVGVARAVWTQTGGAAVLQRLRGRGGESG